ncbi:MAG: Cna B-type domain-containing protein [Firmicutes bacterium]|nr:Cna B-type domain-containing protein [Bacillota bacterium]
MQNKGFRRVFSGLLAAVAAMVFALPFTAFSARLCSLTVNIENSAGEPVEDISVHLAAAAYADDSGVYSAAAGFESVDIDAVLSDPDADSAEELYNYIVDNSLTYTTLTTDSNGSAAFAGLSAGLYLVFGTDGEAVSFDPYIVILPDTTGNETVYDVVSEPKTADSGSTGGVSINVTKIWDDNMNTAGARPDSITVILYLNGAEYTQTTLDDSNGWKYTFTGLPDSGAFAYTINEVSVKDYVSYEYPTDDGFELWNEYSPSPTDTPEPSDSPTDSPEPTSTSGTEVTDAPTSTPEPTDTPAPSETPEATAAPSGTPEPTPTPSSGTEVTPTPSSGSDTSPAPSSAAGETPAPTDTPTAAPTESPEPSDTPEPSGYHLSVSKVWDDNDDEAGARPSAVTVQLIEDNVVVKTATLNENNGWRTVFYGLDEDSKYTVKEITPTDYSASYSGSMAAGYVITNTYTEGETDPGDIPEPSTPEESEKASVTVSKVWDDNDDSAGARPESVTVYLITGGSVYGSAELSAENDWTYTFTELPSDLTYTFAEKPVTDYTAVYSGSASEGFTATNSYTPGSTVVDDPLDPSEPEPKVSPTPTPTPTKRPSHHSSSTPSPSPTAVPSGTDEPSESGTPSGTDTPSKTSTPSGGDTPSDTGTPSDNDTPSESGTPIETDIPSESDTPSDTGTPTDSDTPSESDTPTDTGTPADSGTPDEPVTIIPQTGENYILVYALSGAGAVLVIAGLILIIGGDEDARKKRR